MFELPGFEKTYLYASKYSSVISSLWRLLSILSKETKSSQVIASSGKMGIWKKKMYHDLLNWSNDECNSFLNTLLGGAPMSIYFCSMCSCFSTNTEPMILPQSWQTRINCLRSATKTTTKRRMLINDSRFKFWFRRIHDVYSYKITSALSDDFIKCIYVFAMCICTAQCVCHCVNLDWHWSWKILRIFDMTEKKKPKYTHT